MGAGIWAVAAHERRAAPTTAQQRAWARLVPHLEAGAHLRAALGDGEEAGPARQRCARERLRETALSLHRARRERSREERGLDLWAGLVAGRSSLVDRFVADGRRLVVAIKNPPSVLDPRALTERERQIVELAAEGASNKNIAYTLGIGESGVGTQLGRALRKLGLERRTELAPAMRAVAVEARLGAIELAVAGVDLRMDDLALSSAEHAVVQALLRGLSDREIAIERGTSERTVARLPRRAHARAAARLVARAPARGRRRAPARLARRRGGRDDARRSLPARERRRHAELRARAPARGRAPRRSRPRRAPARGSGRRARSVDRAGGGPLEPRRSLRERRPPLRGRAEERPRRERPARASPSASGRSRTSRPREPPTSSSPTPSA
ncbi:MAG: LuxR C-terminal-related transcriptional regulator [Sandaracinaceae bacterium]|nr:LuxR C-terminal-related transcriptional regulator [Sandaracinaceae bacterium]